MNIIPSNRWFPTNLPERAAWFQNFSKQFGDVAVSLGFTAAEAAAVNDDNLVFQFLADIHSQLKAFEDAVRQYRIIITESSSGQPTPAFPANPAFSLPVEIPTGIFERLNNLRQRILAAPDYTDEIGALLDILPRKTESLAPEEIKPTLKAGASGANYKFTANVMRMGMEAFKIQIRRMDSEKWHDAAFGTSSPLEVEITPTVEGQSERLQVRTILISKNEPVGEPSDAIYVTINP